MLGKNRKALRKSRHLKNLHKKIPHPSGNLSKTRKPSLPHCSKATLVQGFVILADNCTEAYNKNLLLLL
ncbi:hypothetical protein GRJ2_001401800 [Grus japonensis]|uniref:Uncharacterized protein n=1 Tax=Grus japonensis TaxID=30415 RepID=A0ABC9WVK3_GRUJA